MNSQTSLNRPISTPKQLLVEGRTAEIFFREWIESTELKNELQVRDFGSVSNLTGYLKVFTALKDFREKVITIGIVRDAEQNSAASVFQSICSSLTTVGLTPPAALNSTSESPTRTAVFVLPDCDHSGMLETLCWQVLQSDPKLGDQLKCVADYLDCVRHKTRIRNETKARIWTYFSGLGEFDPLLGHSARAKKWDWACPAFAKLSSFLTAL